MKQFDITYVDAITKQTKTAVQTAKTENAAKNAFKKNFRQAPKIITIEEAKN